MDGLLCCFLCYNALVSFFIYLFKGLLNEKIKINRLLKNQSLSMGNLLSSSSPPPPHSLGDPFSSHVRQTERSELRVHDLLPGEIQYSGPPRGSDWGHPQEVLEPRFVRPPKTEQLRRDPYFYTRIHGTGRAYNPDRQFHHARETLTGLHRRRQPEHGNFMGRSASEQQVREKGYLGDNPWHKSYQHPRVDLAALDLEYGYERSRRKGDPRNYWSVAPYRLNEIGATSGTTQSKAPKNWDRGLHAYMGNPVSPNGAFGSAFIPTRFRELRNNPHEIRQRWPGAITPGEGSEELRTFIGWTERTKNRALVGRAEHPQWSDARLYATHGRNLSAVRKAGSIQVECQDPVTARVRQMVPEEKLAARPW